MFVTVGFHHNKFAQHSAKELSRKANDHWISLNLFIHVPYFISMHLDEPESGGRQQKKMRRCGVDWLDDEEEDDNDIKKKGPGGEEK